jgi:hypothetical protein
LKSLKLSLQIVGGLKICAVTFMVASSGKVFQLLDEHTKAQSLSLSVMDENFFLYMRRRSI